MDERTDMVRRFVLQRIDSAARALHRRGLPDDSVHAVRRELKRARAGLRLMRDAMGVAAYRRENRTLRDVAAELRDVRDAKVSLQALTRLSSAVRTPGARKVIRIMRQNLRTARDRALAQLSARRRIACRDALLATSQRLRELPARRLAGLDIGRGVRRTYGRARTAARAARHHSTDDKLHEWRKQVKYGCYQLEVLPHAASGRLRPWHRQARTLAALLGDDHDLALLQTRLAGRSTRGINSTEREEVRDLADRLEALRGNLQRRGHRLGKKLYARSPRKFAVWISSSRPR